MSRYIDTEKIRLFTGFFEKIDNVPKFYEWLETLPTTDEEKIATEYCMKRFLVMITMDSYEKLIAYYNRGTGLDAPTADVVEVVRCKDCKHNQGSCCDYSAVYVRPHGYCQWGERR